MVSSLIIASTSRIVAAAPEISDRGTVILFFFSVFHVYLVLIGGQNGIKMMVTGLFYSTGDGKLTGGFQACFGVFIA